MAQSELPTILSTGMGTLAEIDDATRAFRDAGGVDLTLLHCTSSYPTPPDDTNLRKIPVLREAFGCPVGFSDHTEGIIAAIGATVLGACMIEKHFTLDKNLPGPDHWFSADTDEFRALVSGVRAIEKQLGTSVVGPTKKEMSSRAQTILSCVANKDLPTAHRLRLDDISFRRPGTGLQPKHMSFLLGRTLSHEVNSGHVFTMKDFE
jgi:N-acetylneuraminate synthase/N,N'-diacetyllegionaminate synthase